MVSKQKTLLFVGLLSSASVFAQNALILDGDADQIQSSQSARISVDQGEVKSFDMTIDQYLGCPGATSPSALESCLREKRIAVATPIAKEAADGAEARSKEYTDLAVSDSLAAAKAYADLRAEAARDEAIGEASEYTDLITSNTGGVQAISKFVGGSSTPVMMSLFPKTDGAAAYYGTVDLYLAYHSGSVLVARQYDSAGTLLNTTELARTCVNGCNDGGGGWANRQSFSVFALTNTERIDLVKGGVGVFNLSVTGMARK